MRIWEVFAHHNARGVFRMCSVLFGRFDKDVCAVRRFRNGFRKFSAVLIRCRKFLADVGGFQKSRNGGAAKDSPGNPGERGRARARPGVSGRGRCPGVSGRQKKQCWNCLMGIRVALYSDALSGRVRAFSVEAPQSPRAGGARPRRAWNSTRPCRKQKTKPKR